MKVPLLPDRSVPSDWNMLQIYLFLAIRLISPPRSGSFFALWTCLARYSSSLEYGD